MLTRLMLWPWFWIFLSYIRFSGFLLRGRHHSFQSGSFQWAWWCEYVGSVGESSSEGCYQAEYDGSWYTGSSLSIATFIVLLLLYCSASRTTGYLMTISDELSKFLLVWLQFPSMHRDSMTTLLTAVWKHESVEKRNVGLHNVLLK